MKFISWDWRNGLATLKNIPSQLKGSLFIQDGEKKKLNLKLIGLVAAPLIIGGALIGTFWENKDSSYLNQSSERLNSQEQKTDEKSINRNKPHHAVIGEALAQSSGTFRASKIKYSAKQVIDRNGGMPAGTNFVGKLVTGIDTRDKGQMVKVVLPYGATYQRNKVIENGSTLFGAAHYGGNGDRVFLQFNRLVNSDGSENPIQGQALNSKDFSPGLSGEVYTNTDARMMATMGLSMLAAGADVLVEKESLGHSFQATPKSSLKNAAMAGLSRGAQVEGERRIGQSENMDEYVIVEAGAELIVSLTEAFKSESEFQMK